MVCPWLVCRKNYGYGVWVATWNLRALVGPKTATSVLLEMATTGRYILAPEIFDHIENLTPGIGGEIQLTDAMKSLDKIYGHVFDGKIYDIGNTVEWLKSSIEIALQDPDVGEDLRSYMAEIVK
jgi:UTP--glucose-1-phosphate uridylyltransferase